MDRSLVDDPSGVEIRSLAPLAPPWKARGPPVARPRIIPLRRRPAAARCRAPEIDSTGPCQTALPADTGLIWRGVVPTRFAPILFTRDVPCCFFSTSSPGVLPGFIMLRGLVAGAHPIAHVGPGAISVRTLVDQRTRRQGATLAAGSGFSSCRWARPWMRHSGYRGGIRSDPPAPGSPSDRHWSHSVASERRSRIRRCPGRELP
jgi:hypothetical protein